MQTKRVQIMSMTNTIADFNKAAKARHGSDIRVMVARAVAFGHDDNLVIISGKNHAQAAKEFASMVPGAVVKQEFHPVMVWGDGDESPAYTTSLINF